MAVRPVRLRSSTGFRVSVTLTSGRRVGSSAAGATVAGASTGAFVSAAGGSWAMAGVASRASSDRTTRIGFMLWTFRKVVNYGKQTGNSGFGRSGSSRRRNFVL